MAKLTEEAKRLIVTELACYRTPTDVAKIVGEQLGIVIDRRQVFDYDPLGSHGGDVAKKWKDLFEATRKAFLDDTAAIPVANKAFRLRELNDMAQSAKGRGNLVLAASLLEQAAKECGDAFSNKRVVKVSGAVGTYETTEEEVDNEINDILGGGDAKPRGA